MCLLIFILFVPFYCFSERTAGRVTRRMENNKEQKPRREIKIPTFARLVIRNNISSS